MEMFKLKGVRSNKPLSYYIAHARRSGRSAKLEINKPSTSKLVRSLDEKLTAHPGHARDFAWYRGQRPSPARVIKL